MKRALQKFCEGFEWCLNQRYFTHTVVIVVLLIIGFVGYTTIRDTNEAEAKLKEQIEFLERVCKKAGTSVDHGRGYELRTIYQCPDGQVHIR